MVLERGRPQELCEESRGGRRPELPVPNSPYGLCGRKVNSKGLRAQELCGRKANSKGLRAQELCGHKANSEGLRAQELCGRKANSKGLRAQELCGSRGGRPRVLVPNSPYGLCGRKAALALN